MEADDGGLAGAVINRQDVEAEGTFIHVTFRKEALRGAHHHALLFPSHAEFRQCGRVFFHCTHSNLDKRQRLAVVADQIQFAFDSARHVVLGDEHVPLAPQIPIRVSLSANAGAARFQLLRFTRKIRLFAQASPTGDAGSNYSFSVCSAISALNGFFYFAKALFKRANGEVRLLIVNQ